MRQFCNNVVQGVTYLVMADFVIAPGIQQDHRDAQTAETAVHSRSRNHMMERIDMERCVA